MTQQLEPIFTAVRNACSSRSWSRGIELTRADAVDGVSEQDDTVVLRVKVPGRTVAPLVTLYIEDDEWMCECDSTADACEHVAAAVIALRQARKAGTRLPSSAKAGGRVGYRLRADGQRMAVERVVGEQPLAASLAAILAGRDRGPAIEPTKVDLTIDRFLEEKRVRSLPHDSFVSLMPLLAEADDVELDGEAIRVSAEPLRPKGRLEARGRGYALHIAASPGAVVIPGVALAEGVLRPLGETELGGLGWERLPLEQSFGPERVAELVAEVVPDMERRLELDVRCKLPELTQATRPHVRIEVEQRGPTLSVLPLLVYGDPPTARVDDGKLVHLGGPVPRRDERAEERELRRLREQLDLVAGRRVDCVGADAARLAHELRRYDGDVQGTAHIERYPAEPLSAEVAFDGARLSLRFASREGEHEADAAEALAAFARGEPVVPLLGGGWARLPEAWLATHGARVSELLTARDATGRVARHAEPLLAELCDALEHPRPPELAGLAPLIDGFDGLPRAELPADLQADLRDYQRRGVDWLCFLRQAGLGAVLADDMGLGKTLQTLCAIAGRALVVCPTSVVPNWRAEIARFRPQLSVCVYHGANRELDRSAAVTLTSYALLRGDIERLAAERWDVVVLDESQAIKNPDSQVAQAAYRLEAAFRVTLSGTPVENRLDELWSQMHFANPGLLGGRSEFRERYEAPIAAGEPGAAERLRRRIRPFVLRRVKEQVAAELPPRTDAVLHVALAPEEREVYQAVELATRQEVLARLEEGGNVMQALEALLRLRQAACDAALVPGQERLARDETGRPRASSKVERLVALLEEVAAEGHKALVFSQWTALLDRVEPHLGALPFVRLDGSTRDRGAVVERFQAPDGPPVMLVSLKAGGTGLNLTAADHVFLLDPWWNPAVEEQAADRAHRIGQDKPVMVYRLVADGTVEERILALQDHKRALAEAALGEADRAASLTKSDLRMLLGG